MIRLAAHASFDGPAPPAYNPPTVGLLARPALGCAGVLSLLDSLVR
jgi:hypothetical protein